MPPPNQSKSKQNSLPASYLKRLMQTSEQLVEATNSSSADENREEQADEINHKELFY